MIYKATKEIHEALMAKGLKAFIEENDEMSMVYAGFPIENSSPVQIRFISTDDDNDVAVRVIELMRVKEDHVKAMLPVLNRLNTKFRFLKFTLDKDNDVNVEYDMPLSGKNIGECAMEMTARFVKIIREAYPELMHTVWQ